MDPYAGGGGVGGGNWTIIPNVPPTHSHSPASSNQDSLYLHHQPSPQSQQQLNQFQQQQLQQQYQFQQPQRFIQQQQLPPPQPQPQQQSLASHFHLSRLVENLADVIENGTRDQQSDALVTELNNHFEKCQQLLNSISGSISSKAVMVDGQKRKLEETEHLLNQRKDLISKYRKSVEELISSEP